MRPTAPQGPEVLPRIAAHGPVRWIADLHRANRAARSRGIGLECGLGIDPDAIHVHEPQPAARIDAGCDRVDGVEHEAGRVEHLRRPARSVTIVGRDELDSKREDSVQQRTAPTGQPLAAGEIGHQQQLAVRSLPAQRRRLHEHALQIPCSEAPRIAAGATGRVCERLAGLVQVEVLGHAGPLERGWRRLSFPHDSRLRIGHAVSMYGPRREYMRPGSTRLLTGGGRPSDRSLAGFK